MASNPTLPRLVNMRPCLMVAALLTWALLFAPSAAYADEEFKPPPKLPPFLRLEYNVGPSKSCPDREPMEWAIIAAARRDPLNDLAPALLQVTIKRRGPFYVATVDVRDKDGGIVWHRPWNAPLASCGELVRALGYLVGSELREDPPEPPAPPAPAPAKVEPAPALPLAPVEAPPARDKADPPPSPSGDRLHVNIGVASLAALRSAPPLLTFNLIASAGLRWRSFSGALEFRWTPPEAADDVRVMQYAGRVVPCGHFRALVYCGVGEVTAVVANGVRGAMVLSAAVKPSAATGVRVGADVPLPILGRHVLFRPWLDALVTVRDVRIHFDDGPLANGGAAPTVWMTPRFSVFVGAGILMDLWRDK